MPMQRQNPKEPYKQQNPNPKNHWERPLREKPSHPAPTRQTHIPFGMGKHRKSFGHV